MQANDQDERQDKIEMQGVVIETMPASTFRVEVNDSSLVIIANLSGRMRQNKIRVIMGDKVLIETSPYDLSRGRITRRL